MRETWSDDLARTVTYTILSVNVPNWSGYIYINWTNFNHKGPPRQLKDSKERYDELVQYDTYIITTAEFVASLKK